jgi:TPR repeat protein
MKMSQVGTPFYVAPEIMKMQPYNTSADIFSYGVILYRLMTNRERTMYLEVLEDEQELRNSVHTETKENYLFGFVFLVMQMLSKNATKRPSAQEIAQEIEKLMANLEKKETKRSSREECINTLNMYFGWNWEEVEAICDKLLELNDKDLFALSVKGCALTFLNHEKEYLKIINFILTLKTVSTVDDEFARALAVFLSGQGNLSLRYFKKASEKGFPLADYFIGNIEKNIEYVRKCAQAGLPLGQLQLGICYLEGTFGMKRDLNIAKVWFRKAADQGLPQAMYHLGMLNIDTTEGIAFLKQSADRSYPTACLKLSEFYAKGKYVTLDLQESLRLKVRAAEKSKDQKIAYEIADAYEKGLGVQKDKDMAYKWFKIAAERGHHKPTKISLFSK